MSKIKNGGLDQYGAEPFEHQQFGTAGVERIKISSSVLYTLKTEWNAVLALNVTLLGMSNSYAKPNAV